MVFCSCFFGRIPFLHRQNMLKARRFAMHAFRGPLFGAYLVLLPVLDAVFQLTTVSRKHGQVLTYGMQGVCCDGGFLYSKL